jgi:hypothetical protein
VTGNEAGAPPRRAAGRCAVDASRGHPAIVAASPNAWASSLRRRDRFRDADRPPPGGRSVRRACPAACIRIDPGPTARALRSVEADRPVFRVGRPQHLVQQRVCAAVAMHDRSIVARATWAPRTSTHHNASNKQKGDSGCGRIQPLSAEESLYERVLTSAAPDQGQIASVMNVLIILTAQTMAVRGFRSLRSCCNASTGRRSLRS